MDWNEEVPASPAGASKSQFEATNSKTDLAVRYKLLILKVLVPKKGLEPPHPCEYVDLNHARLPIPPLRHKRALWRVAPEQAATLSLANAARSVKFRRLLCVTDFGATFAVFPMQDRPVKL